MDERVVLRPLSTALEAGNEMIVNPIRSPEGCQTLLVFRMGLPGLGEVGKKKEQGCQFFCPQSFSNAEAKRSPRTRTPCVPRWTVSVG